MTCVFLALGAVNAQNNLLFLAFGFGLGGLVTSGLVSGASLMGLRVKRRQPGVCAAGEPGVIRYEVANVSAIMPAFCVVLEDSARRRRKGESRAELAYRVSPALVGHLGPRTLVTIETGWLPLRRGWIDIEEMTLTTTFPFGLMRKTVVFSVAARVLAWPARVPVRPMLIDQAARGARQNPQARRGAFGGEDVFGVREYREGDAIKDIAWRSTARGQAVLVRQRAEPAGSRLWITLNLSPASGQGPGESSEWNEPELAIACAGELARQAADRGLSVGLCVTHTGTVLPPREGAGQSRAILDALGALASESPEPRSLPRAFRRDEAMVEIHVGGAASAGLPGSRMRIDVRDFGAWCADRASVPAILRKGAS